MIFQKFDLLKLIKKNYKKNLVFLISLGFLLDTTGDVNSDDANSNAKDFNSIPERNMRGNNNILDSTEWDGEEKSINNNGNMLAVETFMPSSTVILLSK